MRLSNKLHKILCSYKAPEKPQNIYSLIKALEEKSSIKFSFYRAPTENPQKLEFVESLRT